MRDSNSLVLKFLSPGFAGTTVPDYIKQALEQGLAGVTLFGSNTLDFDSTRSLIESIRKYNPDCIISIDEESGDVTRLFAEHGSPFPAPYLLGRIDDVELTEKVFESLGSFLAELDIDLTFAPVLDLIVQRENPIVGLRSFGSDPDLVARHGRAAIRGLAKAGVNSCPKHFPGHGNTLADSHHTLPQIGGDFEALAKSDLVPFEEAINSGVKAIMVGHLVLKSIDSKPASLSQTWIVEILQEKLGFKGSVVTDALDMGALGGLSKIGVSAREAIRSGAHLLCLSGISDQREILKNILEQSKEIKTEDLERMSLEAQKRNYALRRMQVPAVGHSVFPNDRLIGGLYSKGELAIDKSSVALLTLEADPTVAAGKITWGLDKALLESGYVLKPFDLAKTQIIQFRDAWRDGTIRGRLDMLLREHPNAIFVDFGWPTEDFNPSNLIRTFGASKAHSNAAIQVLTGK